MSTKIPILSVYDENGNRIEIPAIKGDPGNDYVLTAADKQEIATKAAEIVDENLSVSIDQCDFIEYTESANLFNKNTITEGMILSGAAHYNEPNMVYSDFIPVKPSTTYVLTRGSAGYYAVEFNLSKVAIGTTTAASAVFTTSANTYFIRQNINIKLTPLDTYMLVEGSTLPSSYIPYGQSLKICGYDIDISGSETDDSNNENQKITVEQCDFIEYNEGANLFNKNTATDGMLLSSGAHYSEPKMMYSDFIPVKPNTKYIRTSTSAIYYAVEYNTNKAVIGVTNTNSNVFTTTASTYFVRLNINSTLTPIDTYMFVEGDSLPSGYIPYGQSLKICGHDIDISGSGQDGLIAKWGAIGDSLTNQEKWQPTVLSMLNIPEWHKNAITGSCVADYSGTSADAFVNRYLNTPSDCDCITIMGGTNDCTSKAGVSIGTLGEKNTNTFIGAYQTIIEGLLSRTPSARILLITPPRCYTAQGTLNTNLIKYVEAVEQIAEHYGLPCLDLYHNMGWNDLTVNYLAADYVHFTDAGGLRVGRLIGNFIRNNY